jgi:hypothetical protein
MDLFFKAFFYFLKNILIKTLPGTNTKHGNRSSTVLRNAGTWGRFGKWKGTE